MIEIGHKRIRAVKTLVKDAETGKRKLVPKYEQELPVTEMVANEVWRVTRNTLGGHFGPDGKRKLVVGLCDGDILTLKPKGTRQVITVELKAVYSWCLRTKALGKQLEKARARKATLIARRQRRNLRAAEHRLVTV